MDTKYEGNTSVRSLLWGFVLCLVLTLFSYTLVLEKALSGSWLLMSVLGLTTIQALVQCVFFLHMGKERKPQWGLITLIFTVIVLIIVVLGSLWIMYNLDYNMMKGD